MTCFCARSTDDPKVSWNSLVDRNLQYPPSKRPDGLEARTGMVGRKNPRPLSKKVTKELRPSLNPKSLEGIPGPV